MKLTIEPSALGDAHYYPTVTIDTRTNDEGTAEAVEAFTTLIIAAGHYPDNVYEAMIELASDRLKAGKVVNE